jgi:valyl-tRNA synthetase
VPGTTSARAALRTALSAVIRLFAPFLPFVTEEVWSWWQDGSVHRAPWPTAGALGAGIDGADPEVLAVASEVIAATRKAKSEAKLSMRAEVASVQIAGPAPALERVALAEGDLRSAGRIARIERVATDSDTLRVTIAL